MAQYRTCPRAGLQFDLEADKLMRWNAVAGVLWLLVGGITALLVILTRWPAIKQPPASNLLKKVANIASGSGEANKKKVAKITKAQLLEATKLKLADLNTTDLERASRIMAGTARQMGIDIAE